MTKSSGYWQAVDNLAYHIRRMTIATQVPVMVDNPFILEEDEDTQVEFCNQFMTAEQKEEWDRLDDIFATIMFTYKTTFEETHADVFKRMIEYDIESGDFPC